MTPRKKEVKSVSVKMVIPDAAAFVKGLLENLPEYAQGPIFCESWNYKDGIFLMYDEETETKYTLTVPLAIKGLQMFLDLWAQGKYRGCCPDPLDEGSYDSDAIDAIIQLSLLGEVVYG